MIPEAAVEAVEPEDRPAIPLEKWLAATAIQGDLVNEVEA